MRWPEEDSRLQQLRGDGSPRLLLLNDESAPPESADCLEDWIPYSGVTALKLKLNGGDLAAEVDRLAAIDRVTIAAQAKRGFRGWLYSLDFNERCPNVQYLLDFERQIKAKAPTAFERVQYIEQPTALDLAANRGNTMFEAAKLRPVVID